MTRWILVTFVVGAIGLLAGCSGDPTGSAEYRISISTDKLEYSLASDSIAVITLRNAAGAAVHLPMGMYVFYEQRENGTWSAATAWFIADGVGPSFSLAPGTTMEDRLPLRFYLGSRPGTYRIQYRVFEDNRLRRELPLTHRVSQPFTVSP
jgi:hypothetical protein